METASSSSLGIWSVYSLGLVVVVEEQAQHTGGSCWRFWWNWWGRQLELQAAHLPQLLELSIRAVVVEALEATKRLTGGSNGAAGGSGIVILKYVVTPVDDC
jgi:hypothetical protein